MADCVDGSLSLDSHQDDVVVGQYPLGGPYIYIHVYLSGVGCCAVTIKLTENGEEDSDSIAEAYDRK